ncbi:nucleoside diphosphate kinase 6-like [Onthophagus taurus]|uniref:nucleoside diphosphate kinase 6-like n=1 Tax=Onthophagus taurus TaxID=166361 RepID=UPI000C201BDF|nr:nucleoside diphosphate kinase 6-like [Onthophagus taurus]
MELRLQLTLAILKPHLVSNPFAVKEIRQLLLKNQFNVIKWKKHRISMEEASKFYEEHKKKFFYNRLVTFVTSGPSEMYILAKINAINDWRRLMGPTKVFKAQFEAPNTIRGTFGLSDTRNATHGSDSDESAKREISILFPDFNYDLWFKMEEESFRMEKVDFIENEFVHKKRLLIN